MSPWYFHKFYVVVYGKFEENLKIFDFTQTLSLKKTRLLKEISPKKFSYLSFKLCPSFIQLKKDSIVASKSLLFNDGFLLSNCSVINQMVPSKYNYDLMSNIFAVIAVIARVWSNCTTSLLHPIRKFQIAGFPSEQKSGYINHLDFQMDA